MKILIVDKDASSGLKIRQILEKEGLEVEICSDGKNALNIIRNNRAFRIVIIHQDLHGIDGITLCREIRRLHSLRYLYIVIIAEGRKGIYEALDAGADDFITGDPDNEIVDLKIKSGIRILKAEEKLFNSQRELIKYVREDAQTSLLNKRSFMDEAVRQLERAFRETYQVSMIITDLGNFRNIEEVYGKQFAEKILFETAGKLKSQCRPYDIIGRFSGEEFIILLPNTDINAAKKIAKRIKSSISKKTYEAKGEILKLDLSIGISTISPDIGLKADQIEDLTQKAEIALNKSKKDGKNTIAVII